MKKIDTHGLKMVDLKKACGGTEDCEFPGWYTEIFFDQSDGMVWSKQQMTDIKTLRQRAGLTQKQLAKLAGCHVTQIQKLEYGLSDLGNLTARTYLALCDALDQPYTLMRDREVAQNKDLAELQKQLRDAKRELEEAREKFLSSKDGLRGTRQSRPSKKTD